MKTLNEEFKLDKEAIQKYRAQTLLTNIIASS